MTRITDPSLIAHLNKAVRRELLSRGLSDAEATSVIELMTEDQSRCQGYIDEFSLESLRTCTYCGKPMSEGYLVDDADPYCSEECVMQDLGWNRTTLRMALQDADQDDTSIYYTNWD